MPKITFIARRYSPHCKVSYAIKEKPISALEPGEKSPLSTSKNKGDEPPFSILGCFGLEKGATTT